MGSSSAKRKSHGNPTASHVYTKNLQLQTVDKRCLYNRAKDTNIARVYTASNVDGKRKYTVYLGKTMQKKQVGGGHDLIKAGLEQPNGSKPVFAVKKIPVQTDSF